MVDFFHKLHATMKYNVYLAGSTPLYIGGFWTLSSFYVDVDDMNKGPHAHTASILQTKQVWIL